MRVCIEEVLFRPSAAEVLASNANALHCNAHGCIDELLNSLARPEATTAWPYAAAAVATIAAAVWWGYWTRHVAVVASGKESP